MSQSPAINRPVANLSFALNYYFSGLDPFAFHLTNLLIHLAAAFSLYLFLNRLLRLPRVPETVREKSRAISLVASMFWGLHPIQTQAVTYIVQRMTSLCGLFYFLSLYFYLEARCERRPTPALLAGGFALLAVGTKEIAALLPLTMIAIDFFLISDPGKRPAALYSSLAGLTLGMVFLFLSGSTVLSDLTTGRYPSRGFTVWERMLTEMRIVFFYLSLIFFPLPSRLSLTHDFPLSTSLTAPWTTAVSFLALLSVAVFILFSSRALLRFLLFWCFAHLAIESSVVNLELIFEHRLYLPSVAPLVAAAVILLNLPISKSLRRGLPLALAGLLLSATYARNSAWQTDETLWEDTARKAPGDPRAHYNLAVAYTGLGRWEIAKEEYQTAIRLRPNYAEAHNNLGLIHQKENRLSDAVGEFEGALQGNPDFAEAHFNLGIARAGLGDTAGAIEEYRTAIRLKSDYLKARYNLGIAYVKAGKTAEAVEQYRIALRLKPDNAEAWNNLGLIQRAEGNLDEATRDFEQALTIRPEFLGARANLAEAYATQGAMEKAIEQYRIALQFGPDSLRARYGLGVAYQRSGRKQEAREEFEKALRVDPGFQPARQALQSLRR